MAFHDLQSAHVMPIHYETFRLSREPLHEPLTRFLAAASKDLASQRVVGLSWGEPFFLRGIA
jgi:L-ascorbate metabolism protein UlaG (beta-lactamase superfamily)